jgi:hypothetical protein
MAYTLPMLLAEWETIGSTEPFPMAAAGILLTHFNRATSDDVIFDTGVRIGCMCNGLAATSMENPPQRYVRKGAWNRLTLSMSTLDTEPLGAAGKDAVNAEPNIANPPQGPT